MGHGHKRGMYGTISVKQTIASTPPERVSTALSHEGHPDWVSPTSTAEHGSGKADPLVYTVAETGNLLGISRAFAYELVARGELPVIRLGRRRLVPKVALLALLHESPSGDGDSASE